MHYRNSIGLIVGIFAVLLAIILFLPACNDMTGRPDGTEEGAAVTPSPPAGTTVGQQLAEAVTRFGNETLQALYQTTPHNNIFISPVSISTALVMAFDGARGQTRTEIGEMLHINDIAYQDLIGAYEELLRDLTDEQEGIEIRMANALWIDDDYRVSADYQARMRNWFSAEVAVVDFQDPATAPLLNSWVRNVTHDRIDNMVTAAALQQQVVNIMNAIYFKGQWAEEFNPDTTYDREFHNSDGTNALVRMMRRAGEYYYCDINHESGKMQVVRLPYTSDRYSMYIFLPRGEYSIEQALRYLQNAERSGDGLQSLFERFRPREGDLHLPRFSIEYERTLNDVLVALGMTTAFMPGRADFGTIGNNLFISEVKHKSFLKVSEEGTEAAAATSVGMRVTSMPLPQERFEMVVDHPFVLLIRDEQTGQPLFTGIINTLTDE